MVTLELTQKSMRTSMEVMVVELRTSKVKRILEFCAVMNMTVRNTLFKKRVSHLVTYESGISKTWTDYSLVRRNQRKFLEDIKVLPGEECITQYNPLVRDFKIRKAKGTRRKFAPRRKI